MSEETNTAEAHFLKLATPNLFVLSGPSGVGKDAALARLKQDEYAIGFVVTATTRAKRPGERDGIDYHFLSSEKFHEMVADDGFLEWAEVYGNYYGVPRQSVSEAMEQGGRAIVKVDIQGAETIKRKMPEAVFIFLAAPSVADLAERLQKRNTETPQNLTLRTSMAAKELEKLHLFNYLVINRHNQLEQAVNEIKAIITAEGCRVSPEN